MRWRVAFIAAFLLGLVGVAQAHAQTTATPSFVPGACHFKPAAGYTAGKNLTCGMLFNTFYEQPGHRAGRLLRRQAQGTVLMIAAEL